MIAAALRWIAWSVVLARGGAWCERDYAELLDDVGAAGRAQPDPASWFRDVVRLAMLDFLDFADGDGGADGCLALADPWARRAWSQNSALYQLYDGALKLHGCKKFLWHRRPIDEARLQQIEGRDFPSKPNGDKAKKPAKKRHKSKVTAKAAKGGRAKAAPREPALVAAAAALGLAAALLVARARRA